MSVCSTARLGPQCLLLCLIHQQISIYVALRKLEKKQDKTTLNKWPQIQESNHTYFEINEIR